jgi:putative FmdB family regulatory protein
LVPIYEFECSECGARFEVLVAAGTVDVGCPDCGAQGTRRLYSAPGAPFNLVKTPAETRRQEGRNAELREATRRRFKQARQRVRQSGRGRA